MINRKLSRTESLEIVVQELVDEVKCLTGDPRADQNPRVEMARHVLQGGILEHKLIVVPTNTHEVIALKDQQDGKKVEIAAPLQESKTKGLSRAATLALVFLTAHNGQPVKWRSISRYLSDHGIKRRGKGARRISRDRAGRKDHVGRDRIVSIIAELRRHGYNIFAMRGRPTPTSPRARAGYTLNKD